MKIKSKDYKTSSENYNDEKDHSLKIKTSSENYKDEKDYSLKVDQCNKNIYGYMDSFLESYNS